MLTEHLGRPLEILLVEDNPGDVRLTIEALKDAKIHHRLSVVKDGVEALLYLSKDSAFPQAVKPDLILLDLNLPRKNGIEVLQEIKQNEHLKRIPVVILTTSQSEDDILKAYDFHANCYITKPVDFDHFIHIIHSIKNFWLSLVHLPPH